MGVFEIISAVVLILACVFIVLVVLMQDTKHGMSQTITGGSADNYYQRNSGRSNEAKLNRMTKTAAFVFFFVALAVNFIVIYSGNFQSNDDTSGGTTSSVTSSVDESSSDESSTESTSGDSSEATSSEATSSEATSSEAASSETTSSETSETSAE